MAKSKKRQPEELDDEDIDVENRENGSYEHDDDEEDEGDHDHEEDDRRSRKKKKKKRHGHHHHHHSGPAVMSASGQTDEERRVLRRKQRELNQVIAMGGGVSNNNDEGEGNNKNDELTELRHANNELWNHVKHTREAVLDSENVGLIANKAAREAEKLVQVPRYDANRLAQALAKGCSVPISGNSSTRQFNWAGLGLQVGAIFDAIPTNVVSFLYGPLDAEYTPKERKKPERRKKSQEVESENEEEEEPEDVDQTGKKKSDGNELSAVEKHIKVINRTVEERCAEERKSAQERATQYETQLSQEIDDPTLLLEKKKEFIRHNQQVSAVNCLFNPQSFTQTVENVFHFSFLVKDGRAGIKRRSAEDAEEFGGVPGPVIRPHVGEEKMDSRQAIVSLNMKDWRDMCKAYEVQESDVPHRVDGKVARKEKKGRKSH